MIIISGHDDHHTTKGAFLASLSTMDSESELIEIHLIDKLDETRSFCIDIKGHLERAKVHQRLQAYTCYSYQGQLGVEPASGKGLMQFGRFYMPTFDECVEAKSQNESATLSLKDCNSEAVQKFDFTSQNNIAVSGKHDLC